MKRSMLYVLSLVVAVSLVFASCAGAVTLNWLHYFDVSAPEAAAESDLIQAFSIANPDIDLKIETLYDEAYHNKLAALVAAEALPDVMYLWPGGARSGYLMDAGLIADLYPYLGADAADFVPGAISPTPMMGNNLYELPIGAGTATHMLYVNTELLGELGLAMPQSYAELKAMVPAITGAGLDPIIMPNGAAWVMQSCFFSALVGRTAGTEWIIDVAAGNASYTDSEFVAALELLKEIYDTGLLPATSIQLGYGDGPPLFAEGRGVFMIDGDWRCGAFSGVGGLMTSEEQEKIALTVFPDIAGQIGPSSSTSLVATTGLGMKAGLSEAKAAAAWKLIYFYASAEAARIRILAGSGIPPSAKVDLSDIDLPPLTKARFAFYASHPGTPVLDAVITGDAIVRINDGLQELGLGDITPEQLAAEIEAVARGG